MYFRVTDSRVAATGGTARTTFVGYFQNTNGLFRGDDVRILGAIVGKIESERSRAKVIFWVDSQYKGQHPFLTGSLDD